MVYVEKNKVEGYLSASKKAVMIGFMKTDPEDDEKTVFDEDLRFFMYRWQVEAVLNGERKSAQVFKSAPREETDNDQS